MNRSQRQLFGALGSFVASWMLFAGASPAAAQDACSGHRVRALGGSHSVVKRPMGDLADLQKRVSEIEASARAAIASDPTLGPDVADALAAAIASGEGIGERKLGRNESVRWMAYQPTKGTFGTIAPPCIQLNKDYDAFEITLRVPQPAPEAPQDAVCNLTATRNCEHESPTVTVDLAGSAYDPAVTMTAGGATSAVSGAGSRWSVADPLPYSSDLTFTVRAHGSQPQPRMARVLRFLIPKACGNLTYLGEGDPVEIAPAGAPATCEKSVAVAQCKPWSDVKLAGLPVDGVEKGEPVTISPAGGWHGTSSKLEITGPAGATPLVVDNPTGDVTYTPDVANCGDESYKVRFETRNAAGDTAESTAEFHVRPHDWIARGFLFSFDPTGSAQKRTLDLPGGTANESFELDRGWGLGASAEHLLTSRWGVEGAALFGRTKSTYRFRQGSLSGSDDHNVNFYALTVGPNLHLLECKAADLYLGAFVGYGGFADPNYWVGDRHFRATFDGDFVWGAQLGLDVPFNVKSDWGFHAGVRYYDISQTTDAGSLSVDPLSVEAGLSYRF